MSKKKKQNFEVLENETIDDCLKRMEKEGYKPVRRIEKPVFKEEINNNGETEFKPVKRVIIFEGMLME